MPNFVSLRVIHILRQTVYTFKMVRNLDNITAQTWQLVMVSNAANHINLSKSNHTDNNVQIVHPCQRKSCQILCLWVVHILGQTVYSIHFWKTNLDNGMAHIQVMGRGLTLPVNSNSDVSSHILGISSYQSFWARIGRTGNKSDNL